MSEPLAWLREVDSGTDNACWVVCNKTDPGAVQVGPARSKWQPIETAPKDGTDIIAYGLSMGMIIVGYDDKAKHPKFPWATDDGPQYNAHAFTHWMPLPEPPK